LAFLRLEPRNLHDGRELERFVLGPETIRKRKQNRQPERYKEERWLLTQLGGVRPNWVVRASPGFWSHAITLR
jgi:hypothetical protein